MKVAAIYNVWDDWDLLQHSINNILKVVDVAIVVWSERSNYGEYGQPVTGVLRGERIITHRYEPNLRLSARQNETDKRNSGLSIAWAYNCTHFICMDADEFYETDQVSQELQRFVDNPDLRGLVCPSQVYFRHPALTIGMDRTLVPFIHKLSPGLRHTFNKSYPFAWDRDTIRIDPTRSLNVNNGIEWSSTVMHHMSWVRSDYEKKIRNSTARTNLEKSSIREDLVLAKAGYYCQFYGKTLVTAPNTFNLPTYDVLEIQILQPLEASRPQKRGYN